MRKTGKTEHIKKWVNKGNWFKRAGILAMAAVFALPAQGYAGERMETQGETDSAVGGMRVEQELFHIHIGNEEGSGCYTKEIRHVHEGDAGGGGGCYRSPVYHVHTGNETDGGGCYGKADYHVHTGNETDGKGCYGKAVYHVHAGNVSSGGGCYGEAVYHAHTGSVSSGGGCYGKTVCHVHTGSASSGGGCYGKAVYHVHTGDAQAGGGCYTVPVYHSHDGNETAGGSCYQPVYHAHTDACYTTETCTAVYEGGFQRLDEYDEHCYHHGETLHMTFEGTFQHQSCGQGRVTDRKSICWACHKMDITHQYQKTVCGKGEDTVEGYVISCGKGTDTVDAWNLGCGKNESTVVEYGMDCGKNTSTVDSYRINCGKNEKSVDAYRQNCGKTEKTVVSYQINCGKTEESIDSYSRICGKDETVTDAYALDCGKTEETIDGYGLNCGREENTAYAIFSLSNTCAGWSREPVVLQAACEDEDGFLLLAEKPFVWEGAETEEGGEGSTEAEEKTGSGDGENVHVPYRNSKYTAAENGVYTVRLLAENEDMDKKEPVLSIEVKNIDRTAPAIREVLSGTEAEAEQNRIRVTAEDVQPDGSRGSGLPREAYSFDGGKTWTTEREYTVKENGTVEIAVRDICGNVSRESITVSNIRKEEPDGGGTGDGGDDGKKEEDGKGDTGNGNGKEDEKEDNGKKEDGKEDGKENGKEDTGIGDGKENDGKKEDGSDGLKEDDGNGKTDDSGKKDNMEEDLDSAGQTQGNRDDSDDGSSDSGDDGGNGEDGSGGFGNGAENGREDIKIPEEGMQPEKTAEKKAGRKKTGGKAEKNAEDGDGGSNRRQHTAGIRPILPDAERAGEHKAGKKEHKLPGKEETTVKQKEVKAEPVLAVRQGTMKKTEVMAPVVKAVTFTVSGVAFAAVLLFLLYMMLRSVGVYHQDGEGGSRYAGSYMMKKTENGFEVNLPDLLLEQSSTGQFTLRTGRLFARRHKGEELVVLAGRRKEAVWIDWEIPLKLATFA